jgi:imidazolonepropionase-like amidohydrolase
LPPSKVALKGGRIIPIVGDDIPQGTVLIENGRITAVGVNVDIPYDAMEVDVTGKVLMPGMVDAHSASGLDVPNENLPVTPFLDVYDALDPSKVYFEDALRDGVTSIHVIVANDCVIGGISRVVHPIGLTPDEMTLARDVALKLSVAPKDGWDRMSQMAQFRETFRELAEYLEDLAEKKYEESVEKKGEKIDVGPDEARKRGKELVHFEDYDDPHANLVRLTRGELGAFVYARQAGDVPRALQLGRDHGFFDRLTLVLGPECYKAIDVIKKAGRPVVLQPPLLYREEDPLTGKTKETFVPKVYADAGVPFSLLPSPDSSLAERYLNYQAAQCVRNGISRAEALRAITLHPAKAIGVESQVGSLEKGKVANVVVMSGDPLAFETWVDLVYINGIEAYDRKKDIRLQQLLGDEKDDVAAAEKLKEAPAETKPKEAEASQTPATNDKPPAETDKPQEPK